MPADLTSSYWDGFAQAYARLREPLRPSPEELTLMEDVVRDWTSARNIPAPRAILLGATPAVANLSWPPATRLTAVDRSFPMTRLVWPGNLPGSRAIVCGDWLHMPLDASSCDVAIGDGSINCLDYPCGFGTLFETLSGAFRGDGLLVLRCYIQASPPELPAEIYRRAMSGGMPNFHEFKLRLLMALQAAPAQGVAVRDVYQWITAQAELASLPKSTGWSAAEVATLEYYRQSSTVYAFPTLEELRAVTPPEFTEVSLLAAGHAMGSRCPILVFEVRRSPACS